MDKKILKAINTSDLDALDKLVQIIVEKSVDAEGKSYFSFVYSTEIWEFIVEK